MALTNKNEQNGINQSKWSPHKYKLGHGLKAFTFKFDMTQNTHMHYIII